MISTLAIYSVIAVSASSLSAIESPVRIKLWLKL